MIAVGSDDINAPGPKASIYEYNESMRYFFLPFAYSKFLMKNFFFQEMDKSGIVVAVH